MFTVIASTAFSVSSESFYRQQEAAQHFVLKKDSEFRLFYHNAITLGEGAKWDKKEKLTDTPCFWIDDSSDKSAYSFRQHNTMLVAPCTEYELRYLIKIDKITGDGPFIEFILYDYNTDVIDTIRYPAEIDGPTDGWIERKVILKTDYLTYEVILQLSSDIKGTCDVRFDKVFFKQTSEPGSLMPTPINIMDNESASIESNGGNEKVFKKLQLPITRSFLRLDFDLGWENFDGDAFVYINWISEYGDIIGTDFCQIYNIEGVLPEWNGIAARWKKDLHNKSDKASFKLDWIYDSSPGKGQCNIERIVKVPNGGRFVQIRIVKGNNYKGNLHFFNMKFVAEY